MAVKTLEETLATLSADEKRLFENTLSKNPELKDGWLRQDDYSRKMTALKDRETELAETVAYKERMEPWADAAYERMKALEDAGVLSPDGKELWTEKKAAYERELEEARKQAVGGDMDPAELDKRVREIVKANGGVTPEEMKALVISEGRKLAEDTFKEQWAERETTFNTKTIPFVSGFSTSLALAAAKYERETGKEFSDDDTKAVFELMTKENNFNPREMVTKYAEPLKREKDSEAEIQRRVAAELAKRGMPGGGSEPYIAQGDPDNIGNIQRMLDRSGGATDFESVIQSQAVKAATELRAEGK